MTSNVIRGHFGGRTQEAPQQGTIEPMQAPSYGDLPALERKVAPLKGSRAGNGRKLDLPERSQIARNLGRLFDRLPKGGTRSNVLERAELSDAGDYTKRLPRIAILPGKKGDDKGLIPHYDAYVKVAIEVKKELGEDPELVEFELVAGTRLDPLLDTSIPRLTPDERTVYDSLSDLHEMLALAADSVIQQRDMRRYFSTLARWRLVSGNGGKTFKDEEYADDPGDSTRFWAARIDLMPTTEMFRSPWVDTGVVATMSESDHMVKFEAKLNKQRIISLGIAPIGASGSPIPVLIESDVFSIIKDDGWWAVVNPDNTTLRGKNDCLVSFFLESAADASVRPLSQRLLFDFFGWQVSKVDDLSDLWDQNPLIVINTNGGCTRAVPGTVASYIERELRHQPDNPSRLDRMLDADAAEKVASLEQCLREVEQALDEGMQQFRAAWHR
ncbi:hypothetical protein [Paramagnetospirillum magneticum]|uniref:Uncharacterized protein n=1 Tax=Paramagnetospirillum magneticum (strain ATCC 700264 / AMB-1) TaxID=342108 RepID=Q2W9M9_PARM1|nr:hypothetical protein [Paramagnetospirillum magneticum]BAE49446.1 hypothetical protein amb0642 [Paramagnetospirillum magneticum AMB-1]